MRLLAVLCALVITVPLVAQDAPGNRFDQEDKFRQLEAILPTPGERRLASGAPGPQYWQQRADYEIDVEIDDRNQRIIGRETINYHNNSPHTLTYLWVQLDANIYKPDSRAARIATAPGFEKVSPRRLRGLLARKTFDGGCKIDGVKGAEGKSLRHTIVDTMMRVDLPAPLAPGSSVKVKIDWHYKINDSKVIGGRTGSEFFEKDGNWIYEIAQWFPRMVAYTDVHGWHHKQFLGRGEFTLEFGDYLVRITVPDDHVVASTGELQNADVVLTAIQRERLAAARTAKKPVFIVSPEEAQASEKGGPKGKKTWVFKAANVRDFAFASSRKFIWDAMGQPLGDRTVMAMSYYPNEAEPLWSRYSTHAVAHTLEVYSKFTFDYPYPVAISVNGPVGGMEYPMICFNGPRPHKDGTYSKRTKYGLITVIIHEVGHNWFPMIVNSDERQWTWMDEGLNTFLQYLTEQEWEPDYPSRRGEAKHIVPYLKSARQVPIMTNSESILQFGNNAYGKPATGLNILRETILGRELFDFAFKSYARRWKFKRPMPADFFRSMEDASGVDLDWFWRGWFYSTKLCDVSIDRVKLYRFSAGDPEVDKPLQKKERESEPETLSQRRNARLPKRSDTYPELLDFYNSHDPLDVTEADKAAYRKFVERLDPKERKLLETTDLFYVVDLRSIGGLVMPVILEVHYEDGTTQEHRIPAEIWRRDNQRVSKLLITSKRIKRVVLDPHLETSDVDTENNVFPRATIEERFRLFKDKRPRNPMQKKKARKGRPPEKKKGED